jgi:ribosomal protein S18 acetylase RimI-like enzyme
VRSLRLADLPRCQVLSQSLGWPWEAPKWELLLSKGEGFAVDAPVGSLVGTVVLNRFSDVAASIGLLGVAPAWGRQGYGRALMERALEGAGSIPVFLYATEKGRGLYAKLGFRVAGASVRFVGRLTQRPLPPPLGTRRLRRMVPGDLGRVVALDVLAFGAPRPRYLEALLGMADEACVAEDGPHLVGYGLAWTVGSRRTVGPIVAHEKGLAMALLAELSTGARDTLRVDIPSDLSELAAWVTSLGLTPDPPAPLMVRNAANVPGRREWLYALAMPGLG